MNEQYADVRSNDDRSVPDVPDFDLIRPVGSGGFGEVWLATNRTTGRLFAIKLIPLHSSSSADPAARELSSITRLEAKSRCRHPNLLQIHHVGKTAKHLFYVMDPADDISGDPASDRPEYRPATLQSRLEGLHCGRRLSPIAASHSEDRRQESPPARRDGAGDRSNSCMAPDGPFRQIGPVPFSPEVCLEITQQLLAGLAMLHAAGMVHRDVKPANCLFVGGQLKLADFGLLTEAHPLVSRVGTQKYMPPDGRMDMRADVYAAGLVIYEMLSGLPVDEFPRLGPQSQRVSDNPILTNLLRLVLRACEREAEKRPADARAMLAELTTPHREPPRRPRRRLWMAACAAIALAVAGLGAWMIYEEGEAGADPIQDVAVSFITYPFEAKIYLDDDLQYDSTGRPCTTPCTIHGLPARTCTVWFQYGDGPLWMGDAYDLAKTQQIVGKMAKTSP